MRPRLLVLDDEEGKIAGSPGMERLRQLAEVTVLDRPLGDGDLDDLAGVRVLLAIRERTRLDASLLDRLPGLELVLQTGGHAYHVDQEAATGRGIVVALSRRARMASAFGMVVLAWDRDPGREYPDDEPVAERLPLEDLLARSDVVSVHLKLSPASTGLLDAQRLARMTPGAILVNTARGAIVDEQALVEALRSGRLAGAGLDVFATEPLPAGHPLRTAPNVVITPHIGWKVEEVF